MRTAATMRFGELTIRYDERVLLPREWTQHQSRWATDLAAEAPAGSALELCTGAGHIGLLFARLSGRRVVAVDVDPVACEFARANAAAAGLTERFDVRLGPMGEALRPDERFGVVIADPPWVRREETGRFPEDPVQAIDGGVDGLDLARSCLAVAERHLAPGGAMVLQLGNAEQATSLAHDTTRLRMAEVRRFDRGVLVHLTAPADR